MMKKCKRNCNEDGLTLVEILASLVIISIVLISFSTILLQAAKHTKYNKEKLTEVDIAEEVVGEMREANSININLDQYNDSKYLVKEPVCETGPSGLSKVTIEVEVKEGQGQKKSSFITEIYLKLKEEDGCAP